MMSRSYNQSHPACRGRVKRPRTVISFYYKDGYIHQVYRKTKLKPYGRQKTNGYDMFSPRYGEYDCIITNKGVERQNVKKEIRKELENI